MAKIYVDNHPYEADPSHNLLYVCLSLGMDLPYFCWHPAMGSVGACRQCAVKQFRDEYDKQGRIVMACMTPATMPAGATWTSSPRITASTSVVTPTACSRTNSAVT